MSRLIAGKAVQTWVNLFLQEKYTAAACGAAVGGTQENGEKQSVCT